MGIFSIFGTGKKEAELTDLLLSGAVVIDVRSPEEFKTGHVAGSINVPLGSLPHKLDKIKKMGKPVITCCASGMRSANAATQLKSEGITALNGGPWTKVRGLIG